MKTILFGKKTEEPSFASFQHVVDLLYRYSREVFVCREVFENLSEDVVFPKDITLIRNAAEINGEADFLVSVGGDGTFLDSLSIVGDSRLPILGINTGRLGFLSSVNVEQAEKAFRLLKDKAYSIEKRKLLELYPNLFEGKNHALNDICIQRIHGAGSMISIDVVINNDYMNTYWCDGLIIATPTGSTAYSLGCGGPIIVPDAEVFVLTPIASHSLTVRPVVIPSDSEIKIKVGSRNQQYLLSLDSSSRILHTEQNITVSKSKFHIHIVSFKEQNYYKTIRQKLMWGIDKRKS
ncbi:MAG: NAD kinase [Bacteroidales bacterium]|jgi:NAD+ kinase|nr:NAD kinase [Bacteroidales bacterium]